MIDVGAVHGQSPNTGGDRQSGPGGEAEVGVDDVEALARVAPAQVERSACERPSTGGKLVELDVQPVEAAQRIDLVAHKPPALGMGGVGQHVRDDERVHGSR